MFDLPRYIKLSVQRPREIPTRPWRILSIGIFKLKSKENLDLVDFYSKFTFVYQIQRHPTSLNIIMILKKVFSEHGIPEILISDNGRQYSSAEFRKFTESCYFKHSTSIPCIDTILYVYYPSSNGISERTV